MAAIEIKDLQKTYFPKKKDEVKALKGVTFSIEPGEVFGLLGPNGAGKSTLINILGGVVNKTGGKAYIDGIDIDDNHREAKKLIGIVPQEISYDSFLTVQKALELQFGYFGLQKDQKVIDHLLKHLALTDKRDVIPRWLSGGMKRRFMIARALIHSPKILVLDEPTAGVDVELRHELYALIRELNQQGTTIILTSHYLEEVELLCDRVAIIHHGKLVALDHKEELKNRFQSTRTFKIALTDAGVKIPDALKKFSPVVSGNELSLTFEENEYQEILRLVAKADFPLANFTIIEPSLEDVFVKLTDSNHS